MPNLCTNNLLVTGDEKEVKRFHDAITKGEMKDYEQFRILDNLLPTPKELQDTPKGSFGESDKQKQKEEQNKANIAKFGYADWYDWNCANYGSKWSDYEGVINDYKAGSLDVVFMSAWSPITQGIIHVSKQFPKLNFLLTYEEGGMAFLGGSAIKAGELLNDIEGEYPSMSSEDDDYDAQYEKITDQLDEITKVLVQAF